MGAGGFSIIVLIKLEAYLFVHCCTLWMVEGYMLWNYMFAASPFVCIKYSVIVLFQG